MSTFEGNEPLALSMEQQALIYEAKTQTIFQIIHKANGQ